MQGPVWHGVGMRRTTIYPPPWLPLFDSGDPTLAERVDEELARGFGISIDLERQTARDSVRGCERQPVAPRRERSMRVQTRAVASRRACDR